MTAYTKKIIINLSDLGDAGKSTTMKALGAGLTATNRNFSKFDADKDHHTFFDAYSEKNKNGEAKNPQNPESGCVQIDINNDPQKIADTVDAKNDVVLVDTPGRVITSVFDSFGVDGAQLFIDTLAYNNALPFFMTPWIDNLKSAESIDKIYRMLDLIDIENYETDFKINIIVVLNNGLMNSFSKAMPAQALSAFQNNISVKAIQADPRFTLQTVNLKTQLTQPSINALAGKTIQEALIEKNDPSTRTLLTSLLNDGKNIAKLI